MSQLGNYGGSKRAKSIPNAWFERAEMDKIKKKRKEKKERKEKSRESRESNFLEVDGRESSFKGRIDKFEIFRLKAT